MATSFDMGDKGHLEAELSGSGRIVVGVDEVGRGCIAGPVVAGAVILDYESLYSLEASQLKLVRDSKTLSERQRGLILEALEHVVLAKGVGTGHVQDIADLGIVGATFKAMREAVAHTKDQFRERFGEARFHVLVDGNQKVAGYTGDQDFKVKGDASVFAIAAASILAKQARDEDMRDFAEQFPGYGFETHVGYGTKVHIEGIKELGPCPLHRMNFAPLKTMYPPRV